MNRFHMTVMTVMAVAILSGSATAGAQPDYIVPEGAFNHWALGYSAGTDGIGITVATAAFQRIELRGGFSWFPGLQVTQQVTIDMEQPWEMHQKAYYTSSWKSKHGSLMLDIYPKSSGEFRLTAGLWFVGGEGYYRRRLADAVPAAEVPAAERPYILPSGGSITPDPDGYLHFSVDRPFLRPYVGIGMGHCITSNVKRQVGLDAGFAWVGRRTVNGYDYSTASPRKTSLSREDIAELETKYLDFIAYLFKTGLFTFMDRCPVQPVIKVTVTYKLI